MDGFVCSVLYVDTPPTRAWLGVALLESFDADIVNEAFGEVVASVDMSAKVLAALPNGLKPKVGDISSGTSGSAPPSTASPDAWPCLAIVRALRRNYSFP